MSKKIFMVCNDHGEIHFKGDRPVFCPQCRKKLTYCEQFDNFKNKRWVRILTYIGENFLSWLVVMYLIFLVATAIRSCYNDSRIDNLQIQERSKNIPEIWRGLYVQIEATVTEGSDIEVVKAYIKSNDLKMKETPLDPDYLKQILGEVRWGSEIPEISALLAPYVGNNILTTQPSIEKH